MKKLFQYTILEPGKPARIQLGTTKLDMDLLRKLVDGYVERIKVRDNDNRVQWAYLNEEGVLRNLPKNDEIRRWAIRYYGPAIQEFYGTAVVVSKLTVEAPGADDLTTADEEEDAA